MAFSWDFHGFAGGLEVLHTCFSWVLIGLSWFSSAAGAASHPGAPAGAGGQPGAHAGHDRGAAEQGLGPQREARGAAEGAVAACHGLGALGTAAAVPLSGFSAVFSCFVLDFGGFFVDFGLDLERFGGFLRLLEARHEVGRLRAQPDVRGVARAPSSSALTESFLGLDSRDLKGFEL